MGHYTRLYFVTATRVSYLDRGLGSGIFLRKVYYLIFQLQPKRCNYFWLIYFYKALYVSGGSSTHHKEHITVHSASGIVNQYCCRLVSCL